MPAITSPEVYAYARQHNLNPLEAYRQLRCAKQAVVPFFALNPELPVVEWIKPRVRKTATDIIRSNRRFR